MSEPDSPMLQALLAAVPEDPRAALVLADYLEEQLDPRRALTGHPSELRSPGRSAARG
jgi:uncharacterized protein (TIGR02996 family)